MGVRPLQTSAECTSVRNQHTILLDTPGNLTSAFQFFFMLPDPPAAKQRTHRLCESVLKMLSDLTDRIVKYWGSGDHGTDLQESSREAETAEWLYRGLWKQPKALCSMVGDMVLY